MNLISAKLGDRVMIYVDGNWNIFIPYYFPTKATSIPATVIGFWRTGAFRGAILGWDNRDSMRPTNSIANVINPSALDEYIPALFKSYPFVKSVNRTLEYVKEFIGVSTVSNAEWTCVMPGCKKANYSAAKTCYMCGRLPDGKDPTIK